MKKNITLLIIALVSFGKLAAQRNEALLYGNGQKRFDGEYYFAFRQTKEVFSQEIDPMFSESTASDFLNEYSNISVPVIVYKGKIIFYYDDGKKKAECTFIEGVREGKFQMWYENGKPAAEKYYDKGLPSGTWKSWNEDGQLMSSVPYLKFTNGQRDSLYQSAVFNQYDTRIGRSTTLALDNTPAMESLSEQDKRKRLGRNDIISQDMNSMFRHVAGSIAYYGIVDGTATFYQPDGQLSASLQFDKGQAAGIWKLRREGDTVMQSLSFEKGFLKSVNDMNLDDYAAILRMKQAEADNKRVFTTVEQMPEFPGGTAAMQEFIKNNLRSIKDTISGRAVVRFTVQEDGSIKDITIQRSLSKEADAEAIRMIQSMPAWKPGKQNGRAVNVLYTLSVKFGE